MLYNWICLYQQKSGFNMDIVVFTTNVELAIVNILYIYWWPAGVNIQNGSNQNTVKLTTTSKHQVTTGKI